jgi:ubiquitin-activating enzyme E1
VNTRYADYNILFGDNFVKSASESTPFVIGAGALGCEFIKMFALMGVSREGNGKCFCTDDDNI